MTLVTELDTWAGTLATLTGLPATRDPAEVYPPCIYVGLPDTAAQTLPSVLLEVPLWLVAAGSGKPAGDQLLTHLTDVLTAAQVKNATADVLTLGGTDFHAYRIIVPLTVTPDPLGD